MNDHQPAVLTPSGNPRSDDFNFSSLLLVLARHKKKIILLPLAAAVIAAGASFLLPDVFKASSKLLPPQQAQSSASALLSQLGAASSLTALSGIKNPNDMYVGMLKSRTIADRLIAKFELVKLYEKKTMQKTRVVLEKNTSVVAGKDGLITIEVEDTDPRRAAQMTNAYVEELLRLTKVLAVTEAGQRRLFFERQLEAAKDNLATAEGKLKGGLETSGVISVDADTSAIVATVGRLRAQISAKEIQLDAMRAFVTPNNQDYKRVREELSSLRQQFAALQNGRPAAAGAAAPGSDGGLASIKNLRDVRYYQMLYELLAKQFEMARLDETRDSSIIQVLDAAVEPEHRVRPRRAIIVVATFILAFFAALAWALFAEARARALASAEVAAQRREVKSHL